MSQTVVTSRAAAPPVLAPWSCRDNREGSWPPAVVPIVWGRRRVVVAIVRARARQLS